MGRTATRGAARRPSPSSTAPPTPRCSGGRAASSRPPPSSPTPTPSPLALPPGRHLVNLCRGRYAFATAFAAGLIAGRTSLLNADPARLPALAAAYPGAVVAADAPFPACPLPLVPVPPACLAPTPPSRIPAAAPANPAIPADHLAAVVFTSGSTGEPTPHPKRWAALVARSRAAAAQFGFRSDTATVIGTVPPQHMYGFETTILLPLHAAVAAWCGPAFFPGDLAAALGACPGPRVLVTTPLHLRALLRAGQPLPALAGCISATAPLDPALAAEAEAAWNAPVREIFGATECGSIASRRTVLGPVWAPYPGIDLAAQDDGVLVHAPGADPVPLPDLIEPAPGGFRLLGRRTDVVKLGGRRASLLGLNQILTDLPGVDDGAFVVPDDLDRRSTARLVAVVVAPDRTASSIIADLRRTLDPVFLPRRVIRVEAMPRNALGKLPRQALLRLVAQDSVQAG